MIFRNPIEKGARSFFWIEVVLTVVLGALATLGLGYIFSPSQIFPVISKIIVTALFIYFAKDTQYFRYILMLCFVVAFVWICSGAGFLYGRLNSMTIAAVMGTDRLEVVEFIKTIPVLYPLLAIVFAFLAVVLLIKYKRKPLVFSWIRGILLLLLLLFGSFGAFSKRAVEQYQSFMHEKELMAIAVNVQADWDVSLVPPRYKNYVIVIGESVSKDYMSLYGYRLPTTPFLNDAPMTYATNYVAPASYTYSSLSRMLSISEKDSSNSANHVVTLANAAGFETYWLSNQGYLGEFDTRVSAIASKSKHTHFLKKAAYNSINIDDWELFPFIKAALEEPTEASKVIFVHIMGSHPMTCERLFDFPNQFEEGRGKHFDCYLASIQKTDAFLEELIGVLNQQEESYALLYFSDHGMTVEPEKKLLASATELGVHHGHGYQQNYSVPLLWMDSGQTQRHKIDDSMSGFEFIHLYANWLGVSEARLKQGCVMEECVFVDDPIIFDGDRNKNYSELPSVSIQ